MTDIQQGRIPDYVIKRKCSSMTKALATTITKAFVSLYVGLIHIIV
jgi:hypothetical protein